MRTIIIFIVFLAGFASAYSQSFNDLVKRYREFQKQEKYEDMISVCDTMLLKYPDVDAEITYFNRGNTYRHLREYRKSIEDYTNALKIKPGYINANLNRAASYYDLGEYVFSLSDYNKVIDVKPGNLVAYCGRGNVYSMLNDNPNAIDDYSKAIKLDTKYAEAYYNRGKRYYFINLYKSALEDWEKAVTLNPEYEIELKEKMNEARFQLDKNK